MKVLQLAIHYADLGGGPRMIHDLVKLLNQAEHETEIIHDALIEIPFKDVICPLHHVSGLWNGSKEEAQRAANVATQIASIMRPDLVICHGPIDPIIIDVLSTKWKTIKFVHAHHDCPANRRLFTRNDQVCERSFGPACLAHWYLSRCGTEKDPRAALHAYKATAREVTSLRKAPAVLVNSEYVRQSLIKNGCQSRRVRVLPLFSMPDDSESKAINFKEALADHEVQSCENPPVLFVGRVGYEKGLPYLLHAFAHVGSPTRLIVAGDGYHLPECRALAKSLGIEDRVDFLGWIAAHETKGLYRRAGVLAVPSIWPEPFGLIGLEAGRVGCPVVAFDVGGIPEWLGSLVPGTVVPPLDTQAFASAIAYHLAHQTRRAQVAATFDKAHMQRKLDALALLEELVNTNLNIESTNETGTA